MKVSIIILNWNGGSANCIEAVESAIAQNYSNKEIIFVDNGSSDGSGAVVQNKFEHLSYIQLEDNIGCPSGRNAGAKNATGDLIFFLENDGAWANNSLVEDAVQLFNENPDLAVLYTKVEGYSSGIADPPLDYNNKVNVKGGLYLSSSFRGGASIIRRNIFEQVGRFPSDFFRQGEERFVSLLIYQLGFKIAYWPRHTLRHKGSDYQGKSKIVHRFNFANELKTVLRLYPFFMSLYISLAKLFKHFFIFSYKSDLKEFFLIIIRLYTISNKNNADSRVSVKTLNLVENLRRGNLRINLHDENCSIDSIKAQIKPVNHIMEGLRYTINHKK